MLANHAPRARKCSDGRGGGLRFRRRACPPAESGLLHDDGDALELLRRRVELAEQLAEDAATDELGLGDVLLAELLGARADLLREHRLLQFVPARPGAERRVGLLED